MSPHHPISSEQVMLRVPSEFYSNCCPVRQGHSHRSPGDCNPPTTTTARSIITTSSSTILIIINQSSAQVWTTFYCDLLTRFQARSLLKLVFLCSWCKCRKFSLHVEARSAELMVSLLARVFLCNKPASWRGTRLLQFLTSPIRLQSTPLQHVVPI